VLLLLPTVPPFRLHWYAGSVPPLVGTAVKVTCEPEQVGLLSTEIETDGVTVGVTLIVIVFELAVAGLAQLALEVSTHAITSPLAKLDDA